MSLCTILCFPFILQIKISSLLASNFNLKLCPSLLTRDLNEKLSVENITFLEEAHFPEEHFFTGFYGTVCPEIFSSI
jgi:hypothetical protein